MERNEVFAGGGTEGRSGFLRFPRWCEVDAVTYPQNTESGCRKREKGRAKHRKQSVSASRQQRGGKELS